MLFHELHLHQLGDKDRAVCNRLARAFADALPAADYRRVFVEAD
jgi:hypothetical protein